MSLINLPVFQGLNIVGTYRGFREVANKPDPTKPATSRTFLGFAVKTTDAYGIISEKIIECVVSQKLLQKGLPALLAPMAGTEISVPVWSQVWTGAKSSGVTFYVSDEVLEMFGAK